MMMFTRNVALSALFLVSAVNASDSCVAENNPSMVLDFNKKKPSENSLHSGGNLRFDDVGREKGKNLDLVVSVHPGTHYDTNAYNSNRIKGQFGQINVDIIAPNKQRGGNQYVNGKAKLDFCFRDRSNNQLVTVESFNFVFFDLDKRGRRDNSLKERIIIDASQAESYYLYPNAEQSTVKLVCETSRRVPTISAPCVGERTEFMASEFGIGATNPSNPDNLTEKQMKRSVVYTFKNKSCFTAEFILDCGGQSKCQSYTQANFQFAGKGIQVANDGQCYETTLAPPTVSPTPEPTNVPSNKPTVPPTPEPTNVPSNKPTVSPTPEPTNVPSNKPTVPTTSGPTNWYTPEATVGTLQPTVPTTSGPTNWYTPEATVGTLQPTVLTTSGPTNWYTPEATVGTLQPTVPTTSGPTNKPDQCPDAIKLLETYGVTEFPLTDANTKPPVTIVSQDTETVTVALTNAWGSQVESIYYEFRPSLFDLKCFEKEKLKMNESFEQIKIQCNVMDPFARLTICVVDDNNLGEGDNAIIPECCHSNNPEDSPTVCYHLEIKCDTGCSSVGASTRFLRENPTPQSRSQAQPQ